MKKIILLLLALVPSVAFSAPTAAVSIDQVGWRIDANIGGADALLGTSTVASYTEIINGSLDLVLRSGSASAEIPCSSTNPSTGLTCSAGSESLGISFTPPTAGTYEVCGNFGYTVAVSSGQLRTAFQWVETPNNAQTILQEGGGRASMDHGTAANGGKAVYTCGTFIFSDTSKRTLRLMFEQESSGTTSTSQINIDRSAAVGQRDMKITVRRRVEFADAIAFQNLQRIGIWQTPSPLFTFDNIGTPTQNLQKVRCSGDSLEANFAIQAGTVVANDFAINIPTAYAVNLSKFPAFAATTTPYPFSAMKRIQATTGQESTGLLFYDGSDATKMFWEFDNSGGSFMNKTDATLIGSNGFFHVNFQIPGSAACAL